MVISPTGAFIQCIYFKRENKYARAQIRVRIRRGIAQIRIERTCIQVIRVIATDIQHAGRVEVAVVGPKAPRRAEGQKGFFYNNYHPVQHQS